MTQGYYYGKKLNPKPKTKAKPKQRKSDDEINQTEVEYNQLQNQIMQDKIHDAYIKANERIARRQGMIIEASMKRHKQQEDL